MHKKGYSTLLFRQVEAIMCYPKDPSHWPIFISQLKTLKMLLACWASGVQINCISQTEKSTSTRQSDRINFTCYRVKETDLKTWCIQVFLLCFHFFFVLSERDTLDRDITELKKGNTLLEAALRSKSDNLLEVQKEVC